VVTDEPSALAALRKYRKIILFILLSFRCWKFRGSRDTGTVSI